MKSVILFSAFILLTTIARAEYVEMVCTGEPENPKYEPVSVTLAHWITEDGNPMTELSMKLQAITVYGSNRQDELVTYLESTYQIDGQTKQATYFGEIKFREGSPSKVEVQGKFTMDLEEYPIKSVLTCNDGPGSFML